jgi:hypothetical protein
MPKRRNTAGLVSLLAWLVLGTTLSAQEPVSPRHSDPAWQAIYWNNTVLAGVPVLQRTEGSINHKWGTGSPDPAVRVDGFSARWVRYLDLADGIYRFTATSDDGLRVYVDGNLILDMWYDHGAKTISAERGLTAGHHLVVVEFYENKGVATAQFAWEAVGSISNWLGEYYTNRNLSGSPALVRDDAQINFDWGIGSPAPGAIGADRFSVRWTRSVSLAAGTYRFHMTVDDGARLWVNQALLIDAWRDQAPTAYTAEVYLPGGSIPVQMEYYENTGSATAQLSWEPVAQTQNWQGEYYANQTLSGAPALVRDDVQVNFNWGTGSPAPGTIGADHFSVRWTRALNLAAGTYRFRMTVDDGGRLWVNRHLLIDAWRDQAPTAYTAELYLPGGGVPVEMEYYENTGNATAQLSWEPVSQILNWQGEYYANQTLSGAPALVRDDVQVNFNWGTGSPAPGTIGADHFSVRWTRSLNLAAGVYRFRMTVDDGARLWVNQALLIDAWRDQAPTTYTAELYLPGGSIPVQMEYYENTGNATAQLSWSRGEGPPQPAIVVVDDGDTGFIKGGAYSSWRSEPDGYGGDLWWTWNNDQVRPGYNWARWVPNLPAGRYEVSVFVPYWFTTTGQARYWIQHANGYTLRIVSQSGPSDEWVSLGTYWFRGDGTDYVSLADVTFEPYRSRLIAFDAVRWVPR